MPRLPATRLALSKIGVRRLVNLVDDPDARSEAKRQTRRDLYDLLVRSAGDLPPWAALLDAPEFSEGPVSEDESSPARPAR